LDELRHALAKDGVIVAVSTLHRFFARRGFTLKKTAHAIEQERLDVLRQREDWFDGQIGLHPDRLVFIDKTWTATNTKRTHGRCRKGERLRMAVPHGHRKTTTFVAGLRTSGMVAPRCLTAPAMATGFKPMALRYLLPSSSPATL